MPGPTLTAAQSAALRHVRDVALRERPAALAVIAEHLAGADVRCEEVGAAVTGHGRLTVNFHPDRLLRDGRTVVEALDAEGVYRSQFATGISNGGLTAFPGGDRDVWEQSMFGGAYQRPGVLPGHRPTYGGLNLLDHPDGACPRFGSCHLRLRPEVSTRTTFTFGDSHLGPTEVGTLAVFEPVLAALLSATAGTGVCLGVSGTDTGTLLRALLSGRERASGRAGRALDDYIEAQVHGELSLARDVEAVVVDPSFRDTDAGRRLAALADRHGFALAWHPGFELPVDGVDAGFRGPDIPPLAARVHAEFGRPGEPLHAELIGRAAASLVREPQRWADRGPAEVTWQHLKQLWHVLVWFGHPAGSSRSSG
ncbi:DUF3626 domain-containing protein [Micromonospora humi]|uniref:DUF3626 domain-containing protein n=1 Tax=Micromonospora humi TaxID=745366 RepID=A0A1C5KAA4_9ACTN|nr:DUF3626 domain-containing protein [Micromonospora humi]SCG79509.1 Protein of unknown function [Micromonospora humi]